MKLLGGRRWIIFTFGAILNSTLIVILFVWIPTKDEPLIFFIIAGLWGICDAIWQTQINGTLQYPSVKTI